MKIRFNLDLWARKGLGPKPIPVKQDFLANIKSQLKTQGYLPIRPRDHIGIGWLNGKKIPDIII